MKIIALLCLVLVLPSSALLADGASDLAAGRAALLDQNIQLAAEYLTKAADSDPTREEAAALAGLATLAALSEDAAWKSVLEQAGWATEGIDLFDYQLSMPRDPAGRLAMEESFSTASLQSWLTDRLIPEVRRADAYLSHVTNANFLTTLELSLAGESQAVTIDYADVLCVRSLAQALAGFATLVGDYDLALFPQEVWGGDLEYSWDLLLRTYPTLLAPQAATPNNQAREYLLHAIHLYQSASPLLRARTDADRLFLLTREELAEEQQFSLILEEWRKALFGPSDMQWTCNGLEWETNPRSLDLSPWFTTLWDVRQALPHVIGNRLELAGWEDPTCLGIFPGQTQITMQKSLPPELLENSDFRFLQIASYRQTEGPPVSLGSISFFAYYESWASEYYLANIVSASGKHFSFNIGDPVPIENRYRSIEDLQQDFPSGSCRVDYWRWHSEDPLQTFDFQMQTEQMPPPTFSDETCHRAQAAEPDKPFVVNWESAQMDLPNSAFCYYKIIVQSNGSHEWKVPIHQNTFTVPVSHLMPSTDVYITVTLHCEMPVQRLPEALLTIAHIKQTATQLVIHVAKQELTPNLSSKGLARRWEVDASLPGPAYFDQPYFSEVYTLGDDIYTWSRDYYLASLDDPRSRILLRMNSEGRMDTRFQLDPRILSVISLTSDSQGRLYASVSMGESGDGYAELWRIVRILEDGTVDPTYHTPLLAFFPEAIVIQPTTQLLICGQGATYAEPTVGLPPATYRFLADGELDTSYVPYFHSDSTRTVANLVCDSAGRVLMAVDGPSRVIRCLPNGGLDSTFTLDPRLRFPSDANTNITGLGIQTDGRIIIGGPRMSIAPAGYSPDFLYPMLRLLPNGSLDETFVPARYDTFYQNFWDMHPLTALKVLPNDTLLACGIGLYRFTANGPLDGSFGGTQFLEYSVTLPSVRRMAVLPDGRIVLPRDVWAEGEPLRQYYPNGLLNPAFAPSTIAASCRGLTTLFDDEGIANTLIVTHREAGNYLADYPFMKFSGILKVDPKGAIIPYAPEILPADRYTWWGGFMLGNELYIVGNNKVLTPPLMERSGLFPELNSFDMTPAGLWGFQKVDQGNPSRLIHYTNQYGAVMKKYDIWNDQDVAEYICTIDPEGSIYLTVSPIESEPGTYLNKLGKFRKDGTRDMAYTSPDFVANQPYPIWGGLSLADGSVLIYGQFHTCRDTPAQGLARLTREGARIDTADQYAFARQDGLIPVIYSMALDSENNLWVTGNFDLYGDREVNHLAQITLDGELLYGGDPDIVFNLYSSYVYVATAPDDTVFLSGSLGLQGDPNFYPLVRLIPVSASGDSDGDGFGYPSSYELGSGFGWNSLLGYFYGSFHPFVYSYSLQNWIWLAGGDEQAGFYFWNYATSAWGFAQGQWYPYYVNFQSGAWEKLFVQ